MFWFLVPVVVVVAIIAISVWIIAANVRRRGGEGTVKPGRTIYDRDEEKNSPETPPA